MESASSSRRATCNFAHCCLDTNIRQSKRIPGQAASVENGPPEGPVVAQCEFRGLPGRTAVMYPWRPSTGPPIIVRLQESFSWLILLNLHHRKRFSCACNNPSRSCSVSHRPDISGDIVTALAGVVLGFYEVVNEVRESGYDGASEGSGQIPI
jgi:hypothetical protein